MILGPKIWLYGQKDDFPGDSVLHYDYLVGATDNNIGIDNLTLKVNLFKKILDRNKKEIRTDVPYFHFVPSERIWTDYIKGIYILLGWLFP